MSVSTGNTTTVVLGTGDTEIVPAVAGKNRCFLIITNVDTVPRTFRLHVRTGAVAQANAIFYDLSLSPNDPVSLDFYMSDLEIVSGLASAANAINVRTALLASTV